MKKPFLRYFMDEIYEISYLLTLTFIFCFRLKFVYPFPCEKIFQRFWLWNQKWQSGSKMQRKCQMLVSQGRRLGFWCYFCISNILELGSPSSVLVISVMRKDKRFPRRFVVQRTENLINDSNLKVCLILSYDYILEHNSIFCRHSVTVPLGLPRRSRFGVSTNPDPSYKQIIRIPAR